MGKFHDLTGQRFGRLVALEAVRNRGRRLQYKCRCDCGTEKLINANHLRYGKTLSCGCFRNEQIRKANSIHGKCDSRLYSIWKNMKSRCYTPSYKNFDLWGGRGIEVCDDWRDDFQSFFNWAVKNGYEDNLTLDRIDVDGNYEPCNCRWVSHKIQNNNARRNHLITISGEKKQYQNGQMQQVLVIVVCRLEYSVGGQEKNCSLLQERW